MNSLCRTAWILLLGVIILLEGCMFFTLRDELTEMKRLHALTGNVINQTQPESNVVIVLYQQTPDGLKLFQSTLLSYPAGHFVVEAPTGVFYLFAFEDVNSNLKWDEGGPIGYYGKPDEIVVSDKSPRTLSGFDVYLSESNPYPEIFPKEVSLSPETLRGSIVKIGQMIDFGDPMLSLEYGAKGYWQPLTFIREVGYCFFFREKYHPDKIPVLFVHGAIGTPLGWENIVDRLDLDRFQPWYYYYPSGLPLEQSSRVLNLIIMELHHQYHFKKLYVIGHSMGGLVARSFILQNAYGSRQEFIKLFVSISSPWNGHKMSAKGARKAPTAVPSWHDMAPESPFIASLFARKLPAFVTYDLFFSYRGNCSMFLENNDGTVELSSELDIRAQREARRIYGYDEDHGSILTSPETIAQLIRLVSEEAAPVYRRSSQ